MNLISLEAVTPDRRRWATLFVVCLAQLMIVLDVTIVNVALPSIQRELGFSQSNLTWVINAFLVTFGSLLLLAGRLGDLIGRKRVFLAGLTIFTVASLLCGVAPSQGVLIGARFLQGIGAAAQASVILAIIVTEFPQAADRARAMSAYVFVSVAGGSLGLLAGGVLTEALSWHWVFFVNLPIGLLTFALGQALIRNDQGQGIGQGVDWLGSLLVTASLMTAIYAIVEATNHGWGSTDVLGFGALAAILMTAFLALESRIENPIMPLRILRLRGLAQASLVRGFLVTGMYSTFFLGTLYLEHVRHYSALQTGAAFLPWTITVAILSRGITAAARRALRAVAGPGGGHDQRGRRAAAVQHRRSADRLLPDGVHGVLRDRPWARHGLHAAADDRDGRRARRRCRTGVRDHQRDPADQRRARAGGPEHLGRQPHPGPDRRPRRTHQRSARRIPDGVPRRRGRDRHGHRAGSGPPAPARRPARPAGRPRRGRHLHHSRVRTRGSMTTTHFEYPTRPAERPSRNRGERFAVPASRPRRTGMVSEAVVANYIRELAGHDRRVHAAARARDEHSRTVVR